ncbi:hypothetical protein L207DRAFT_593157 [Hyaloscypha variabilis F]|uniref:Aflatoxin regulatory protein domain-containing protein n=1 Tax=Hyaloscypha variabilis (strain UAMH 11265 / GT02V1 / F) TaxID=1149755 RepID=A0A2J6QUA4_HYAVF|nr:hypothetical protein L207DRAFT_593157 [Hyaloscypha variabilis F]
MLDMTFSDFSAEAQDSLPSFFPELQDLDAIPQSSVLDGSTEQPMEGRICLSEGMCCFARASKTLKSLHIPSPNCLSTMGRGSSATGRAPPAAPRTAGSVLTGNREAILALSKLLRCSCSLQIQLQLVMATICDKLVTWYRALVLSNQNFGAPSSSSADPRSRRYGCGTGRERVLCQPITIGDYCVDGAAEAQITGRVVLAHLQVMEFLVGALQRRIKDNAPRMRGGDRRSSSSSEEGGLLGIIGDGVAGHLVEQLQGTREGAASLIRDWHDPSLDKIGI